MLGLNRNETRLHVIVNAVNQLFVGRTRATREVTLAAGATTTTVDDELVNHTDTVVLTPMTAHAAAEIGAGTLYVSSVERGAFTLTHANAVTTDRTYRYLVMGGEAE